MPENGSLTHAQLKTPKAAAIAGIAFSLLLLLILWLLRTSIPADPLEPGAWLATDTRAVTVALNLVPFAGSPFCGLSVCCGTGSASLRTAFSPACFSEAPCYFWRCCLSPLR